MGPDRRPSAPPETTTKPAAARRRPDLAHFLLVLAGGALAPLALIAAVALLDVAVVDAADARSSTAPLPVTGQSSEPTTPSPLAPTAGVTQSGTPRPTTQPTSVPTPEPTPVPTAIPTVRPTPVPTAVATDHALPGGLYADILTAYQGYGDWPRTLLDTIFMLAPGYYPGDLLDTSEAGLNGGYLVRSFVIDDLRIMANDAAAAGAPIRVVSAFRSYPQQQKTFDYWVGAAGFEQALRTSARPGHSEHQLGTTLDFTSADGAAPWEYRDWASTPAGAWMADNAWRYGFLMSYPAGRFAQTGYDYEPWHYRYVGREQAAAVKASGLPLRQFLWERSK